MHAPSYFGANDNPVLTKASDDFLQSQSSALYGLLCNPSALNSSKWPNLIGMQILSIIHDQVDFYKCMYRIVGIWPFELFKTL